MTIAAAILFVLIAVPILYWYSKIHYYRRTTYEAEIAAKLQKAGKALLEIREPTQEDWQSSPFSKFEFKITTHTGGMPADETHYRIIKYQDKKRRKTKYAKGPEVAWVKIETSPFLPIALKIKKAGTRPDAKQDV
jgi:hypothetical protein